MGWGSFISKLLAAGRQPAVANGGEGGFRPLPVMLLSVSLTVLVILTFAPLVGIRFANSDDIAFSSLYGLGDYWSFYVRGAEISGRFYNLISCLPNAVMNGLWQSDWYDLVHFGTLTLAILALAFSLWRLARNAQLAALFAILGFAFFSIYDRFNANISYPAAYAPYLALFALSLTVLHDVIGRPGLGRGVLAGGLFLASLLAHEIFALVFIVTAFLCAFCWLQGRAGGGWRWLRHRGTLPLVAATGLYALAYLGFRLVFGSSYSGTQLPPLTSQLFAGWWMAFRYYLTMSLPLSLALEPQVLARFDGWDSRYILTVTYPTLADGLSQASLTGIVRSLCAALAVFVALSLPGAGPLRRTTPVLLLLGGLVLVLPPAIMALSPLYQGYVAGGWSPIHLLTLSGTGALLILALVVVRLAGLVRRLPLAHLVLRLALALGVGLGGLAAWTSNGAIGSYYQRNMEKWNAAALALRADLFPSLPARLVLVSPQLYESYLWSTITPAYWSVFFSHQTGREVEVRALWPDHDDGRPVFYFGFTCPSRAACRAWLARIDGPGPRAGGAASASHLTILSAGDGAQRLFYLEDHAVQPAFLERSDFSSAFLPGVDAILAKESLKTPNNVLWRPSGGVFRADLDGKAIDPQMLLLP
jgi:hypothetical protein